MQLSQYLMFFSLPQQLIPMQSNAWLSPLSGMVVLVSVISDSLATPQYDSYVGILETQHAPTTTLVVALTLTSMTQGQGMIPHCGLP